MTLFESGIIAGGLTGAAIGVRVGASHGLWLCVAGAAVGLVVGAAAGWLFAVAMICLLSFVGVLWRAARKRGSDPLAEADLKIMTPIAVRGTFVTAVVSLAIFMVAGSWAAVLALVGSACVTAVAAVATCEARRTG
jgi:hypothetical protein